jgi:hypothetical protein
MSPAARVLAGSKSAHVEHREAFWDFVLEQGELEAAELTEALREAEEFFLASILEDEVV